MACDHNWILALTTLDAFWKKLGSPTIRDRYRSAIEFRQSAAGVWDGVFRQTEPGPVCEWREYRCDRHWEDVGGPTDPGDFAGFEPAYIEAIKRKYLVRWIRPASSQDTSCPLCGKPAVGCPRLGYPY